MAIVEWTWDARKAAANLKKHRVRFEIAAVALGDELALSVEDEHPDQKRWRTLGTVGGILLFIVHTDPLDDAPGRIISARRATPAERRAYEQG